MEIILWKLVIMINKIKGYKLNLTDKIIKKSNTDFKKILKSGNLTNGIFIKRFEDKFKNLHKSNYSIACSSGGSALEIIFKSLNLKNKEVFVPSNTFIATYNAIKFSGAKPILVDTKKNSLLISLDEIKKRITKKNKMCMHCSYWSTYILRNHGDSKVLQKE